MKTDVEYDEWLCERLDDPNTQYKILSWWENKFLGVDFGRSLMYVSADNVCVNIDTSNRLANTSFNEGAYKYYASKKTTKRLLKICKPLLDGVVAETKPKWGEKLSQMQ